MTVSQRVGRVDDFVCIAIGSRVVPYTARPRPARSDEFIRRWCLRLCGAK